MIRAYRLGMGDGTFLFITARVTRPAVYYWKAMDEDDAIAKEMYKYLLVVCKNKQNREN